MQRKMRSKAYIKGGPLAPNLTGAVYFDEINGGTWITVDIKGLPEVTRKDGKFIGPFGFHIHEGGTCEIGNPQDPFQRAGGHYNPYKQPHGMHAGDLPVLFSNGGNFKLSFYTDKFTPYDIIGKTVIIHESPDDYRTEPSGNSGRRLACGKIVKA